MDGEQMGKTKELFTTAWNHQFDYRDLPSLDFLSGTDEAYGQLKHSVMVINDCLASIKVETFMVKFLYTNILSERKWRSDLKLSYNVSKISADLEAVFADDLEAENTHNGDTHEFTPVENVGDSLGPLIPRNTGNVVEECSLPKVSNEHDLPEKESDGIRPKNSEHPDFSKNQMNENASAENSNQIEGSNANDIENERSSSVMDKRQPWVQASSDHTVSKDQITIFTPLSDNELENEAIVVKNEDLETKNQAQTLASSVPDKNEHSISNGGQDSSSSNSPEVVDQSVFMRDDVQHNSDEILKIMPYSNRKSFSSVSTPFETTDYEPAEPIYDDIDSVQQVPGKKHADDRLTLISQSDLSLRKTFSAGTLDHKTHDDDIFSKNSASPEAQEQKEKFSQSLKHSSVINDHKRSSSDAGVSYTTRPNRERRVARRREIGHQRIDLQEIADVRDNGIQRALKEAVDNEHKLHMRKWVVAGLVDSERGYLEALDRLIKPMKPIKFSLTTSSPICTVFEFHRIYEKVEELYRIHSRFLVDLEERIANWSLKQIIGDLFTALMHEFPCYQTYIRNNKHALETIAKCKSSETFKNIFTQEITLVSTQEITTYESLFRKPVQRIPRYILAMDDLIKYTPEDHPDVEMLQTFMKHAQTFLEENCHLQHDLNGIPLLTCKKTDRKLLKDAFIVELVDGQRKYRHLFLFDDLFVSAKLKVSSRGEQYAIKWYSSYYDIQFYPNENSESAQAVPVTSNIELDNLKAKTASIKAEIRQEKGMCEGVSQEQLEKNEGSGGRRLSASSVSSVASRPAVQTKRGMDRLKRKLAEQEAALWLALPSLPLTVYHRSGKTHRFLFPSDVARGDWKREISNQQKKATSSLSPLTPLEMQGLAESCLEMRTVKSLGDVNLKDDDDVFTGFLYVVVNSGKGFVRPLDCYVVLEVDYFGHFVKRARTKISKASNDPSWEEGFHIDVEGTRFIKVLCYSRGRMRGDELCGLGTIKLEKEDLENSRYHDYTVILDKQGCILVSIQFSSTLEGIHHRRSVSKSGVFGVCLDTVVEREKSDIPLVVIACCNEVERRGIDEIGIYRVPGITSDVKRLKEKFDENSQEALVYISEADIHAVAGTLKQYFRELPDPLLTGNLYAQFTDTLALNDEQEKEKCFLDLLDQLPPPRKATALFLIEHLRRMSEKESENKMSLSNLATVFGPNLLWPPPKKTDLSSTKNIAMEMASGTMNAMSQTAVLFWYLRSKSNRVRLPKTPEVTRRLFSSKKEILKPRLSSQSEDKLI